MSQRALLIAEKPSVARAIQSAINKVKDKLPYKIDVTNARGHLISLCEPQEYKAEWGIWSKETLPIIPETWKTKITVPDVFNNIKTMYDNGNYDLIINGGDAGREGQLIQHLIYDKLGVKAKNIPIMRLWIDDTTETTIIKGLTNLKPDTEYQGLTDASYLRLYLDWLVGMNLSRGASLWLNRTVAIGRVMTAVLCMIVDRELSIKLFAPRQYKEIIADFKLVSGDIYKGKLINVNKEKDEKNAFAFYDAKEVGKIMSILKGYGEGTIEKVEKKENELYAPSLYNLTDLQKDCAKKFGYSPSKTLDYAQLLYEKGFLSYPRTDSKALSKEGAKEIPSVLSVLATIPELTPFTDTFINDSSVINTVLSKKKYVDDSKVQDHPALIPTNQAVDLSSLPETERNVYLQVAKRLVAIFLPSHLTETTSVITSVSEDYKFKSTGTVIKRVGWKEIFKESNNSNEPKEDVLPNGLAENVNVSILGLNTKDLTTTPPPRYNEATILDAMETAGKILTDEELEKVLKECSGLGTPATRGEILSKLERDDYITKKGNKTKNLIPTTEGIELIEALRGHSIISPEFTAKWEKKLKEVEKGQCGFDEFYKNICGYINLELSSYESLSPLGPVCSVIGKCPLCKERDFVLFKNFGCCEGYANQDENGNRLCSFSVSRNFGKSVLTDTDVKALITEGKTRERSFSWKNGTSSIASLKLVKEGNEMKVAFNNDKESLGNCPICSGRVFIGSKGYYCENRVAKDGAEPTCTFSIFGKFGKTNISKDIIKEILENGRTKKKIKITYESGKSFTDILAFSSDFKKLEFVPYEVKELCKCIHCADGVIMDERNWYSCSNFSVGNCSFRCPKKFLEAEINPEDINILMTGGTVPKNLYFKKNNSSANKRVKLEKGEDGTYKLKF